MSFKEIGYSYIHLTKEGFERNTIHFQYPTQGDIADVYRQNAVEIKQRFLAERQYEDEEKANKAYEYEMNKILSLFSTANTPGVAENIIQKEQEANAQKIIDRIKKTTKDFYAFNGSGTAAAIKEAMNDAKRLDAYIKSLNTLIKELKNYNASAVESAANLHGTTKSAISRATKTSVSDATKGFYVLNVNTTGQTSLKNLAEKVKVLEGLQKQLKKGGVVDISTQKVSYTDHTTGKRRTRPASELIGGMGYQITNIQGAIGEYLAFALAEREIKKGFLDDISKTLGAKISIRGAGSDTTSNKLIGENLTAIGDIKIEYKIGEKDAEVVVSAVAVSAKAQFTSGKNKSKTTTFGTTTVGGLLERARELNTQYSYLFLNGLAHGGKGFKADAKSVTEGALIRRYIAARAMRFMLGGLEGSSKDNVYFLKYADTAYRVDEYFNKLAESSFTKLPMANVNATPNIPKKDNTTAYLRSKAANESLMKLKATVTKNI